MAPVFTVPALSMMQAGSRPDARSLAIARRDASLLNALNLIYEIYFITHLGFFGPIVPVRK